MAVVIEYLAHNPNFNELFADYPRLTMDDVKACFAFAQALVESAPPPQEFDIPIAGEVLLDEGLPFRLRVSRASRRRGLRLDHPQALADGDILAIAYDQQRLLDRRRALRRARLRDHQRPRGVILFRLGYVSIDDRISFLQRVLTEHAGRMRLEFVVVSPQGSRIGFGSGWKQRGFAAAHNRRA